MAFRKINLAHFAFIAAGSRGWTSPIWSSERYLSSGRDLPAAKRTLRWLQDELIAAARRSKPPLARLLKLTPSQIERVEAMPMISLEDFQAEIDPDGVYSETELIEQFQERFGEADHGLASPSGTNA